MISGIDLTSVVEFSLVGDKKNPTIWKLGCLPSSDMAKLVSIAREGSVMEQMLAIVKKGVKGWDNFNVEYKADEDGLLKGVLDQIPISTIIELGTKILEINKLSGGEVKN